MKLITILGARPQFVKAAVVSRAIINQNNTYPESSIEEIIVHTGQHFDNNMSDIFFKEMQIPFPKYQLSINSLSHGAMTAQMLKEIEDILQSEKPDIVLVYGDTNSTLAGALAAVKLHIPIAHIEAGMRSYNKKMPEEINRILSDHCTDLFFTSSSSSCENLLKERVSLSKIKVVGDVMYDAFLFYKKFAAKKSNILNTLKLSPKSFALMTMHRASNTDQKKCLEGILDGLEPFSKKQTIVLPLHPRTKKALENFNLLEKAQSMFTLTEPLGYFDMIELEQNANLILTDSGGVQKEAYFANVPCVTLREETEWTELVDLGANILVGSDPSKIQHAITTFFSKTISFSSNPYGSGHSGEKIAEHILEYCGKREVALV